MRATQNLSEDMIPSLYGPEPEPTPKPKASLPATSRSFVRRQLPGSDRDDVEIIERRTLRAGPSRSGDDGPTSVAESQQEHSDLRSKRKLQESPSQVQPPSKRVRRTQRPAESEDEVDLSGHTFPEDSEIGAELVPRTEGKVSILVVHTDFPNCLLGLQPLPPEGHPVSPDLAQEQVAYHRPLYAVYDLETGLQLQGRELGDREVAYIDYHEGRTRTPCEGNRRKAEGDFLWHETEGDDQPIRSCSRGSFRRTGGDTHLVDHDSTHDSTAKSGELNLDPAVGLLIKGTCPAHRKLFSLDQDSCWKESFRLHGKPSSISGHPIRSESHTALPKAASDRT